MKFRLFKTVPKLFLIIGMVSIILNIIFFGVDLLPKALRKLKPPEYLENANYDEVEKLLVNGSYELFASSKLHIPWPRPANFLDKVKALNLNVETRMVSTNTALILGKANCRRACFCYS